MAPLANSALALAINNHLSPTLPVFSSAVIITREDDPDTSDTSDTEAEKARKKHKETIRNILIITLNPVTLLLAIWIVFCFVRGVNRHIRYLGQKKKVELENLAMEMESRRQWEAHFGPGSNSYRPPSAIPEKTVDEGSMPPRKTFFSLWPWSKQNPEATLFPVVVSSGLVPAKTTTEPIPEKAETYVRASNDTGRTLEVDSAPDRLTDDIKDVTKGLGN